MRLRTRRSVKAIAVEDETMLQKLEKTMLTTKGRFSAFAAVVRWMKEHKVSYQR